MASSCTWTYCADGSRQRRLYISDSVLSTRSVEAVLTTTHSLIPSLSSSSYSFSMKFHSGHEAEKLEGDELKQQEKDFIGYKHGLVRLNPGRWLFPGNYTHFADAIYNFKFKSSDVCIVTWPKCGTNWTQEVVWTMRNNPNLDHPDAGKPVIVRSPFIDFDMFLPTVGSDEPFPFPMMLEAVKKMAPEKDLASGVNLIMGEIAKDPRTLKCHMPFSLMPPDILDSCKVVYVARNPKDVIVSYYHHCKMLGVQQYVGNFNDFAQYFVEDNLVYGPYWLHLKEAWERRNHPNLHIIFFEEMKADPLKEIKKLDKFLNTNLTEEQMENVVKYTSFGVMKTRFDKSFAQLKPEEKKAEEEKKPSDSGESGDGKSLLRKGIVGDWKNRFTPEMEAKVNDWIQKNLTDFGISFKYGI